jgi:hypothetical protein
MWEASQYGELSVCQWLLKHGAAATLRIKNILGMTPMFIACRYGHLDVAKWLYEEGAADDILSQTISNWTPMFASCSNGHLQVAKWLYDVGAFDHIRTEDNTTDKGGDSPLSLASYGNHHSTVLWLVLQGAANDETSGHVDAVILARGVPSKRKLARKALSQNLAALLDQHSSFVRSVLLATRIAQAVSVEARPTACDACSSKKPRARQRPSPLALLCGHEDTLLALIADFAGVVRGRQLRNAREASEALIWRTLPYIDPSVSAGFNGHRIVSFDDRRYPIIVRWLPS